MRLNEKSKAFELTLLFVNLSLGLAIIISILVSIIYVANTLIMANIEIY